MSLPFNKYTEKEKAVNNELQIFRLAGLLKKNRKLFYEVCDVLPFYVNINDVDKLDSSYANNTLEYLMELEREKIIESGFTLIRSISHAETLEYVIKTIKEFEKASDHNAICSYFQYLKFHNKWQWIMTYKMFLSDRLYLNMGQQIENFGNVGRVLADVLGDTLIRQDGWLKFRSLSKREKQILKMIGEGYSRKEISERLFISENTVRTHRSIIRQKIDAHSVRDIIRFVQAFEITGQL